MLGTVDALLVGVAFARTICYEVWLCSVDEANAAPVFAVYPLYGDFWGR
jgi:hypothetical protein